MRKRKRATASGKLQWASALRRAEELMGALGLLGVFWRSRELPGEAVLS